MKKSKQAEYGIGKLETALETVLPVAEHTVLLLIRKREPGFGPYGSHDGHTQNVRKLHS